MPHHTSDQRLADSAQAARATKEAEDDFWAPQRHAHSGDAIRYPRPSAGASLAESVRRLVNGALRIANALLQARAAALCAPQASLGDGGRLSGGCNW